MPVDPNILMGYRPPVIQQADPMEQYGRSLQLQGLLRQQGTQDRAEQEQMQVRSIMQSSGGDPNATLQALLKAGTPTAQKAAEGLISLQTHQAGQAKTALELAQLQRQDAFRRRVAGGEFLTPGQPAQPAVAESPSPADELGGGPFSPASPAIAARAPSLNLTALEDASVAAGVGDPLALAKERRAEAQPKPMGAAGAIIPDASVPGGWRAMTPPTKPMVEHNMPVGDGTKVQPHISTDGGLTWKPVPGSVASPKFARQVPSTIVTGDHSNYANVVSDGKGGWVGLNKRTNRMEQIPAAEGVQHRDANPAGLLQGPALDMAASSYLVDKKMPTNLGRGVQGPQNTVAILTRAAKMAEEKGMTGEALAISQLATKAIATGLGALERQRATVMAYEKTALAGADIAVEMSDKVDRTGIPLVNKWVNAGRKNILGDPDVTRLNNAVETFTNEYAKVMSGSSGGQATTVSMQQHAREMLSGAMTKDQLRAAVNLMKREMTQTRETAFDKQIDEMKSRMAPPSRTSGQPAALPGAGGVRFLGFEPG